MKDLNSLFDDCLKMVLDCGLEPIPIAKVTINSRAKGRFGQCKIHREIATMANGRRKITYPYCTIEISSEILKDEADEDMVKSTIIHEILHACDPGEGHGGQWLIDAHKIMNTYPQIKISRCSSYEDFGIEDPRKYKKPKYQIRCEKCGYTIARQRMSKVIKHPSMYFHPNCGGKFERV